MNRATLCDNVLSRDVLGRHAVAFTDRLAGSLALVHHHMQRGDGAWRQDLTVSDPR